MGCFHPENLKPRAVPTSFNQGAPRQSVQSLFQSLVCNMEQTAREAKRSGHERLGTVVKEMTCLLLEMSASGTFGSNVADTSALPLLSEPFDQTALQIGPMALNLDTQQVTIAGQPLQLTTKEYALLELLVLRRGTVLTKEQLLGGLYAGREQPDIRIIDVFVCKLRRKLTQAGVPDLVTTVWGQGYTMHAAVSSPRPHVTTSSAPLVNGAFVHLRQ